MASSKYDRSDSTLSPKENAHPQTTVEPEKLRYSSQTARSIEEGNRITNVPGDSAFDAAIEVEASPADGGSASL